MSVVQQKQRAFQEIYDQKKKASMNRNQSE